MGLGAIGLSPKQRADADIAIKNGMVDVDLAGWLNIKYNVAPELNTKTNKLEIPDAVLASKLATEIDAALNNRRIDRDNLIKKFFDGKTEFLDAEGKLTPDGLEIVKNEARMQALRKLRDAAKATQKAAPSKAAELDIEQGRKSQNELFENFSDAIYKIQRGQFAGERPSEMGGAADAAKARNERILADAEKIDEQIYAVTDRINSGTLREKERAQAQARLGQLEGRKRQLMAGLSQTPGEYTEPLTNLQDAAGQNAASFIEQSLSEVNAQRIAKRLKPLNATEETRFRILMDESFSEFINRASGSRIPDMQLVAPEEGEAEATYKDVRPATERPFTRLGQKLKVLRGQLQDVVDEFLPSAKDQEAPVEKAPPAKASALRKTSGRVSELAESIKRIDEKMEKLGDIKDVAGIKSHIASLQAKLKAMKSLRAELKGKSFEELFDYGFDDTLLEFLGSPKDVADLERRVIPANEKMLADAQKKVAELERLEKLKTQKKEQIADRVSEEAQM